MTTDSTPLDRLVVHSFAVGHGDCTLLEYLQGDRVALRLLCDAGTAVPDGLLAHLEKGRRDVGEPDIDVAILSHVDNDHQGGFHSLFGNTSFRVAEYWSPCLPAFRRHTWLFAPRVAKAVESASLLEDALRGTQVPVIYPMEGYTWSAVPRRVTVSVLSPPARLLRRLLASDASSMTELLTSTPLPLEWLVAGAPFAEDEQNGATLDLFSGRSYLSPDDLDEPFSQPLSIDKDTVQRAAAERAGAAWEPDFFGNSILNDTSLVVAVDVLLDGRNRRRVLLTGDQENWAYIASKHPAGLSVDVLKAPHHGGRVYLADRSESKDYAVEQMYLWMRPRNVLVSAKGLHGLPHVRFRDALRAAGSSLICPNTRTFEPLTSGARAAADPSCYVAYGCGPHGQRPHTVLTLQGEDEWVSAPTCLQGSLHRGTAPIVVLQQRLVEPDEGFVRWTRTELEKHASWVRRTLHERHKEFTEAIKRTDSPNLSAMQQRPVTWSVIEAQAKADGRHQLASDPTGVLKYGVSQGLFWTSDYPSRYSTCELYRASTKAEIDEVRAWLRSMPDILLYAKNVNWGHAKVADRVALLQSADLTSLGAIVAGRLRVPHTFVEKEVLPQLVVDMAENFTARFCRAGDPSEPPRPGNSGETFIHLYRKERPVPDLVSEEWSTRLWERYELDDAAYTFVMEQARKSIFVPAIFTNLTSPSSSPHASKSLLDKFAPAERYSSHRRNLKVNEFPTAFATASWVPLWNAPGAEQSPAES